jgi:hypothetical protein
MKIFISIRILVSLLAVNAGMFWGVPAVANSSNATLPIPTPCAVIHHDTSMDSKAGAHYTYTRTGFEQDIILHERPTLT